jgi:hypothetical protein
LHNGESTKKVRKKSSKKSSKKVQKKSSKKCSKKCLKKSSKILQIVGGREGREGGELSFQCLRPSEAACEQLYILY